MTSTKQACALLGASRATRYRRRRPPVPGPPAPRPAPPNALTEAERQHVLAVLRSAEYCDLAPAQVWARLLDDGIYLCSISTMYRLLAIAGENRERRRQRTHPARKKPELIARRPNQVWSWDITKLQGPQPRRLLRAVRDHRHLQPLRRRAGWCRRPRPASSPKRSSPTRSLRHGIEPRSAHPARRPGHIDDLQARRPAARRPRRRPQPQPPPRVSNDNPYSRSRTSRPSSTARRSPAGSARIHDARSFCAAFFDHYNHVHRHAGIGLHTPASVHYGTATEIRAQRAVTLDAAYAANPARFRHRRPQPPKLPTVAWINEPTPEALIKSA